MSKKNKNRGTNSSRVENREVVSGNKNTESSQRDPNYGFKTLHENNDQSYATKNYSGSTYQEKQTKNEKIPINSNEKRGRTGEKNNYEQNRNTDSTYNDRNKKNKREPKVTYVKNETRKNKTNSFDRDRESRDSFAYVSSKGNNNDKNNSSSENDPEYVLKYSKSDERNVVPPHHDDSYQLNEIENEGDVYVRKANSNVNIEKIFDADSERLKQKYNTNNTKTTQSPKKDSIATKDHQINIIEEPKSPKQIKKPLNKKPISITEEYSNPEPVNVENNTVVEPIVEAEQEEKKEFIESKNIDEKNEKLNNETHLNSKSKSFN